MRAAGFGGDLRDKPSLQARAPAQCQRCATAEVGMRSSLVTHGPACQMPADTIPVCRPVVCHRGFVTSRKRGLGKGPPCQDAGSTPLSWFIPPSPPGHFPEVDSLPSVLHGLLILPGTTPSHFCRDIAYMCLQGAETDYGSALPKADQICEKKLSPAPELALQHV